VSDVKHPVGSRIRFLLDLIEPASGDAPSQIYAKEGDLGQIVGYNQTAHEGYWVTWDRWEAKFGASSTEFEVI